MSSRNFRSSITPTMERNIGKREVFRNFDANAEVSDL